MTARSGSHRALLATDLDGTLVGDAAALERLGQWLQRARPQVALAYVTGRSLGSACRLMQEQALPMPEALVANVGSSIYWGPDLEEDRAWHRRLSRGWNAARVLAVTGCFPTLVPQAPSAQHNLKCSFDVALEEFGRVVPALRQELHRHRVAAKVVSSSGRFVDVLPPGSGKGSAVRHVAEILSLTLQAVLTCGDSGNDRDMLDLDCPAILVANCQPEIRDDCALSAYRSAGTFAAGILEGLRHFGWW